MMVEANFVNDDAFSSEFLADSERWHRIFKTAINEAKAENERFGIVEDYSKYDDWDKTEGELSKVAEDETGM